MPTKEDYWKYRDYYLRAKKKYYNENKVKISEYYANWYKKYGRLRSTNYTEIILKWQQEHPEGVKAQYILRKAVKIGKIIKPIICSKCNKEKKLSAHHEDYSKPLEVIWLCNSCHKLIHLGALDRL